MIRHLRLMEIVSEDVPYNYIASNNDKAVGRARRRGPRPSLNRDDTG